MSSKKELSQISASEAGRIGVTSLATRPNDASRYGQGGLSAKELQAWFDKLPNLVRERFNEIAKMLASSEAAKYIGLDGSAGDADNLFDFLSLFGARGSGIGDVNISDYIQTLYQGEDESEATSHTLRDIVQSIVSRFALVEASKGARLELTAAEDGKITVKLLNANGELLEEATAGGPVGTAGIADGAVTGKKIAPGVVTSEKLDIELNDRLNGLEDGAFEKVSYDAATGVISFESKNGTVKSVDLPLELIVKSGRFDEVANDIVLELANGQEIRIPLDAYVDKVSEFITDLIDRSNKSYKDVNLEDRHLVFEAHDGTTKDIDLSSFALEDEVKPMLESLSMKDSELQNTDENLERRVSNIEQHISDDYFLTDESVAYVKPVPANACSTAKLLSIGGMTYRDEETQTLRDSKVTEIVSEGVNKFNFTQITSQSSSTIEATVIDENTFTLTSKVRRENASYLPITIFIPIESGVSNAYIKFNAKPIGTGAVTKGLMNMNVLDAAKNKVAQNLSLSGVGELTKTFDIAKYLNGAKGYLEFALFASNGVACDAGDGVEYSNAIVSFDADVPYTPYKEPISYPIPTEMQAGDGISNTVYNYIDYEKNQYIKLKRVNRIVLNGTEQWGYNAGNSARFRCQNVIKKAPAASYRQECLCNKYLYNKNVYSDSNREDGIVVTGADLYIRDASYTTVEDFVAYLKEQYANGTPLTVVYQLETPIETDISEYLKDFDNLVEVEGDGSLKFVNEYEQAVPSAVKYLLKEDSTV